MKEEPMKIIRIAVRYGLEEIELDEVKVQDLHFAESIQLKKLSLFKPDAYLILSLRDVEADDEKDSQ